MPMADSNHSLCIEENWDLTGRWKVIRVDYRLFEKCVWNGTHALLKVKAQEILTRPKKCVLLAEPDELVDKALLVEDMGKDMSGSLRCQYVGALYFHPEMLNEYSRECSGIGQELIEVRLLGGAEAEADEQAHHSESDEEREGEYEIRVNAEAMKGEGQEQSDLDIRHFISTASRGDEAALKNLLLQSPNLADVREPVSQRTALHYSIWRGHEKVVKLLIERGADVNLKDDRVGRHRC
jgi:hypothetical protein